MTNTDKKQFSIVSILALGVAITWYIGLALTPTDQAMGEIYRVIYFHVPCAITAFALAYVLFFASILSFRKSSNQSVYWGRAAAELGFVFTVLTLATGSIWGYPTWGVWWTWDARITTTFLLALLYAGYILLYNGLPRGSKRTKACAILGILIAVDVPIIYKSVTWWRTLHQPPSILREGGSSMDPEMLQALLLNFGSIFLLTGGLLYLRVVNLNLASKLEAESYNAMES